MEHNYCTPGAETCEGWSNACPRCADLVCDAHAQYGLCLACQDDADELGVTPRQLLEQIRILEEVA